MSKKRTTGWIVTLLFVGTSIGVVIILILRFINGPVSSSVTINDVRASTAPTPKPPNLLSGLAIQLSYPGIFDQVSQVKTDAQATEQYNLGSNSEYRRSIAVAVRSLPSNSLSEDSSYRWRQLNTALYRESSSTVGGEPVRIMTKLDKTEQTLFWAHKGKILTVSVTSTQSKDDVAAFMAVIQPTIRWRS